MVERRPEKAGVASSILASGTTRSRHTASPEQINTSPSSIRFLSLFFDNLECKRPEMLAQHRAELIHAFRMAHEFAKP